MSRLELPLARGRATLRHVMLKSVKAHVRSGRLVVDEPTDLPDGTEIELVLADWDDLGDGDREKLHAALDASEDELRQGKGRPAAEVLAEIKRTMR